MTRCKSLIEDFIKKDCLIVTYGDNGNGVTMGYGSMKCNSTGFKNISYVKGLQHNLISISKLFYAGYEVLFNKREGKFIDQRSVTVLSANQQNDVYVLDMFSADNSLRCCFFSRAHSHLNWLWNKRLSHLNFKNIS